MVQDVFLKTARTLCFDAVCLRLDFYFFNQMSDNDEQIQNSSCLVFIIITVVITSLLLVFTSS